MSQRSVAGRTVVVGASFALLFLTIDVIVYRLVLDWQLRLAISNSDYQRVDQLLSFGANPHECGRNGETTLMCLSGGGSARAVRKLIQIGIPINTITTDGASALIYAGSSWDPEITRLLIDRGADIARDGADALANAVIGGHLSTVRILLEAGVDPNTPDGSNTKPLHHAITTSNAVCTSLLLQFGADPNSDLGRGFNAWKLIEQEAGTGSLADHDLSSLVALLSSKATRSGVKKGVVRKSH